MMVIFISQSTGTAIEPTRRVLDAFASRIGDNAWCSLMTEAGVKAVQSMLRSTATVNTAVCCHWIRSHTRRTVLWTVGRHDAFTEDGLVPVNSTMQDLLVNDSRSDWQHLPLIKALAELAALFHDFGKANKFFQKKIQPSPRRKKPVRDPWRHEYLSFATIATTVELSSNPNNDKSWLQELASEKINETKIRERIAEFCRTDGSLSACSRKLPPAAALVGWLILSHHRLPLPGDESELRQMRLHAPKTIQEMLGEVEASWGYANDLAKDSEKNQCLAFDPKELLSASPVWLREVGDAARALLGRLPELEETFQSGSWREIAFWARFSLMLGDHNYSSKTHSRDWQPACRLYANSKRDPKTAATVLDQALDEHLVFVSREAGMACERLPRFEKALPKCRGLDFSRKLGKAPAKFAWQDKAARELRKWRESNPPDVQGFFAVNIASTGCGKTLANAKMMKALSEDGESLRYTLALGLRTLTLQTGDEYRGKLGLGDDEVAVVIGSSAFQRLHEAGKAEPAADREPLPEELGSESLEGGEDLEVNFSGAAQDELLSTVITDRKALSIFEAPVLVCTIDHLMGATETARGGRYFLPSLRLLSADLIIDEVDDFTGSDLIAITRLVYQAGLFGRKVMISSATITPGIAEGLFAAYEEGWEAHAASHGKSRGVGCAWIDEFHARTGNIRADESAPAAFREAHERFAKLRVQKLSEVPTKRKMAVAECLPEETAGPSGNGIRQYFETILDWVWKLHGLHASVDEETGIRVSFGLIRTANIPLCVRLTRMLLKAGLTEGFELRALAYHSRQLLIMRHEEERHLDSALHAMKLADPIIREHLKQCKADGVSDLAFILVATPVEEVGRDHDFDWAIVEPSSFRSLIQLAGRVRRHRDGGISKPNIAVLQYNLKGLQGKEIAFTRPGYESRKFPLSSHNVCDLLDTEALSERIDAVPRLLERSADWKTDLAQLEHHSIDDSLQIESVTAGNFGKDPKSKEPVLAPGKPLGFTKGIWWMTALPQALNPFRKQDGEQRISVSLVIDCDGQEFRARDEYRKGIWNSVGSALNIEKHELNAEELKRLWLRRDYFSLIEKYSRILHLNSKNTASEIYGSVELTITDSGKSEVIFYDDQIGFFNGGFAADD